MRTIVLSNYQFIYFSFLLAHAYLSFFFCLLLLTLLHIFLVANLFLLCHANASLSLLVLCCSYAFAGPFLVVPMFITPTYLTDHVSPSSSMKIMSWESDRQSFITRIFEFSTMNLNMNFSFSLSLSFIGIIHFNSWRYCYKMVVFHGNIYSFGDSLAHIRNCLASILNVTRNMTRWP